MDLIFWRICGMLFTNIAIFADSARAKNPKSKKEICK
jgi:hypothetical protein